MYVVVVEIELSKNGLTESLLMILSNSKTSLDREPGCYMFDVNVSCEDEKTILLYEVYKNRDAFQDHLSSQHFIEFDRKISPFVISKSVSTFTRRN